MRRFTHRQYQLTLAWLYSNDANHSTVVRYLMQVAREIRAGQAADPSRIKTEDLRLKYERPPQPGDPDYFEITPEMEEQFMRAAHGMI